MAVEIGSGLGKRNIGSRISAYDQNEYQRTVSRTNFRDNIATIYPGNLSGTGMSAYLVFSFKEYNRPLVEENATLTSVGDIILPLPADLQDHIELNYSEEALGPAVGSALNSTKPKEIQQKQNSYIAAGAALAIGTKILDKLSSALTFGTNLGSKVAPSDVLLAVKAYAANPYLSVFFKSPKYKRFHMSWIFVPENAKDTDTLKFVFNKLRYHALPSLEGLGALYGYPDIVKPRLFPEGYQFDFKYCVVESATLDYVPGDTPAFQAQTRAPVAYKLTLDLLEIELWTREDIGASGYGN